jgi:hypothetical protein
MCDQQCQLLKARQEQTFERLFGRFLRFRYVVSRIADTEIYKAEQSSSWLLKCWPYSPQARAFQTNRETYCLRFQNMSTIVDLERRILPPNEILSKPGPWQAGFAVCVLLFAILIIYWYTPNHVSP